MKSDTWIGLLDTVGNNILSDHIWVMDNSTMTYENFFKNNPGDKTKDCVAMSKRDNQRWHDMGCTERYAALCEASPVCIIYKKFFGN